MKYRPWTIIFCICITFAASHSQHAPEILRVGDRPPALDFTLFNSHDTIAWTDLKQRVVIVEFWATWCPPCIRNILHINRLVKTFRTKPVTFISVTYETREMIEQFLKVHPIDAMIGLDNDFATFKSFKAWGIPMAVIVNKEGIIAGVIHPSDLSDSLIEDVLAGKTPRMDQAQAWPDPEGAEKYFRSLMKKPNPAK